MHSRVSVYLFPFLSRCTDQDTAKIYLSYNTEFSAEIMTLSYVGAKTPIGVKVPVIYYKCNNTSIIVRQHDQGASTPYSCKFVAVMTYAKK